MSSGGWASAGGDQRWDDQDAPGADHDDDSLDFGVSDDDDDAGSFVGEGARVGDVRGLGQQESVTRSAGVDGSWRVDGGGGGGSGGGGGAAVTVLQASPIQRQRHMEWREGQLLGPPLDSQDGQGSDADSLNLSLSKSTTRGSLPGARGGAGPERDPSTLPGPDEGRWDDDRPQLPTQRYSPVTGADTGLDTGLGGMAQDQGVVSAVPPAMLFVTIWSVFSSFRVHTPLMLPQCVCVPLWVTPYLRVCVNVASRARWWRGVGNGQWGPQCPGGLWAQSLCEPGPVTVLWPKPQPWRSCVAPAAWAQPHSSQPWRLMPVAVPGPGARSQVAFVTRAGHRGRMRWQRTAGAGLTQALGPKVAPVWAGAGEGRVQAGERWVGQARWEPPLFPLLRLHPLSSPCLGPVGQQVR
jgi:hypothetical protein